MREDYDCEPEHSTMMQELTTEVDVSPSQKAEALALPLDTSSQVSAKETEASMESNCTYVSPTAVAHSSCSGSPTMDLIEPQTNVNLAVNHMLSSRRSSDLKRQQATQDFETLLHQWKAEKAAANKRAKIVHSRKDHHAKVKCTKAVMKAKHE